MKTTTISRPHSAKILPKGEMQNKKHTLIHNERKAYISRIWNTQKIVKECLLKRNWMKFHHALLQFKRTYFYSFDIAFVLGLQRNFRKCVKNINAKTSWHRLWMKPSVKFSQILYLSDIRHWNVNNLDYLVRQFFDKI